MRVPRQRSCLLLLIFFLWILEAAVNVVSGQDCNNNFQVSPQLGLLGSSVELSCVYPKGETSTLSKTTVYWQTENLEVVHEFTAGRDKGTNQNKTYVNRTRLPRAGDGRDFSLQLSNLTLRDSKTYKCFVFPDEPRMNREYLTCVILQVAARFSVPVLTGPTEVDFGEVVVLICSSSNGYPAPNVYWIDNEDGSVFHISVSEDVNEIDPNTQLHSVRSQLTVNATANRSISCLVENPVLRENLTSSLHIQVLSANNHHQKQVSKATQATVGVLFTMLLAGVLVGGWLCKRSFCERYRGVPVAEPEPQLQTVAQSTSLNVSALLQEGDGELQTGVRVNVEGPGSCDGNEAGAQC